MTRIKDPFVPSLSGSSSHVRTNDIPIISLAGSSQANVEDQSLTYNNPSVVYNDIYAYGGLFGFADVQPLFAKVFNLRPTIGRIDDIYVPASAPNTMQSVGPGWFLYINR